MKKNNKKGFTIIELVIVIAVIAILAGVLIPTFSTVIKKANISSDQQAVRQMNTALAAEGVMDENVDIYDVFDVLEESGLSAKDYKALTSGYAFFWDAQINRVLFVDETGAAVYPAEYDGRTNNGKWFSLTQKIETSKPADSKYEGNKVTVSNGAELNFVLQEELKKQGSNVNEIKLASSNNAIDMMGANLDIGSLGSMSADGKTVTSTKSLTIDGTTANGAATVIRNATAVEGKKTYSADDEGHDGVYDMALVPTVHKGSTLTLKNIIIDGMNLKSTNTGNCGFLVGTLSGKLILENVIIKNSSIIGYASIGALVGYVAGGSIEINGSVKIENVSLQTVGGRVGKLIGNASGLAETKISGTENIIEMNNVTTGIYTCEQNSGACKVSGCTESLGLKGLLIDSCEYDKDGKLDHNHNKDNRVYYTDSLVGFIAKGKTEAEVKASAIYAKLEALVA